MSNFVSPPAQPKVYHGLIMEDLQVAIHGQSFRSRMVSEDLTQNYQQGEYGLFNVGLLHTALTGRPGHEPYAPCTHWMAFNPKGISVLGSGARPFP